MPRKQLEHIEADGVSLTKYVARCLDGVMRNSHIGTENYFYYNLFRGEYAPDCCPAYLKKQVRERSGLRLNWPLNKIQPNGLTDIF